MTEKSNILLQRAALILLAFSILPWAAFGFAGLVVAGQQLLTGYDDFPLGEMLGGMFLGSVIGLVLFVHICGCAMKNAFRPAWIIVGSAALFGVLWIPVVWAIMYFVDLEADRAYFKKQAALSDQAPVFELSAHPEEITKNSP